MSRTAPPLDEAVAAAYDAMPPAVRTQLLHVRALIYEVAAATDGVGPLTEALKWGEPAYLTEATGSGSTIRLGWPRKAPDRFAVYFNCRTTLVQAYRTLFADTFAFDGNRAIVFSLDDRVPDEELSTCIAMALRYHLDKRPAARRRVR